MPEEEHQSDRLQQNTLGHIIQPTNDSTEDQHTNSTQPSPSPAQQPQAAAQPSVPTTALPVSPPALHTEHHKSNHYDNHAQKSSGIISLVSGLVLSGFAFAIPNISFITRASSNLPFYIVYGTLTLFCLLSLITITGPSFKKNKYPNVLGLLGLIFNCIVLYSATSYLVIYAFTGNN